MGWRTSNGKTSHEINLIYRFWITLVIKLIGDQIKAPYWRIYTVPALYNADYQQLTTLTYCENNININTKLWKVQKL